MAIIRISFRGFLFGCGRRLRLYVGAGSLRGLYRGNRLTGSNDSTGLFARTSRLLNLHGRNRMAGCYDSAGLLA